MSRWTWSAPVPSLTLLFTVPGEALLAQSSRPMERLHDISEGAKITAGRRGS
jgi:hypothetical protein